MSATVTKNAPANPIAGYVAVRVCALKSIEVAAADLFVQYDRRSSPVLYCKAGTELDPRHFAELFDAGIDHVYVAKGDFEGFSGRLLDSLESFFNRDTVPQTEKFAALQIAVSVEIEHSLRNVDCRTFQSVADRVGRQMVSLLAASDVLPRDLYRIAQHDFQTFAHVTNVASYIVVLAEHMGIHDQETLEQLASAAMLHDIGKRFIPATILNKVGPLDPEERQILESHPQKGYVELCCRPGLEFGQLMMVYQHHEWVNGKGYPVRIMADEIHPWAKLLSVVNVFDVMTAKRPNRRPAKLEDVLAYQENQAGIQFDAEVAKCWISVMRKA
jgi:HD-GYP domain-containing protein (c-di-GMP phosphodiesterase class II)